MGCRRCTLYTQTASGEAEVLGPELHSREAPRCNEIPAHLTENIRIGMFSLFVSQQSLG